MAGYFRTLFDYYIVRKGVKRWRKFKRLSRKCERVDRKLRLRLLRRAVQRWHLIVFTPNISWGRLLRWVASRWKVSCTRHSGVHATSHRYHLLLFPL